MNEDAIQAWRALCDANALPISPDGRVSEATAAELLGYCPEVVARWRRAGTGPRAVRLGVRGSRWSYHLDDLAEFIESRSRSEH